MYLLPKQSSVLMEYFPKNLSLQAEAQPSTYDMLQNSLEARHINIEVKLEQSISFFENLQQLSLKLMLMFI